MYITFPSILRKLALGEETYHSAIKKDKFPERIIIYLHNHFTKPFISDIKRVKDNRGSVFFKVNVSDENTFYRLRFNEEGAMILKETEPLIELDDTEYEMVD